MRLKEASPLGWVKPPLNAQLAFPLFFQKNGGQMLQWQA